MKEVKQFFEKIGRNDIDETVDNLIESGVLDSIEIMNLIQEIEAYYEFLINFDYITPENFRNFQTIDIMLKNIKENN